jgi:hypothetical protein
VIWTIVITAAALAVAVGARRRDPRDLPLTPDDEPPPEEDQ